MTKRTTNDSNGQSNDHGGGGDIREEGGAALQNLTNSLMVNPMTMHVMCFLNLMKQIFQNQPEKYETFQAIMLDFKAQRIDIAEVGEKVKELFEGHNDLISKFNAFLPEGYEISPDDEDEASPKKTGVNYEEALDFVYKIKERFQDDNHVYPSFKDILNMYRSNVMDTAEVYKEVSSLFGNHPDLLEEFTRFLPDDSATTIQHTPYDEDLAQCFNEQNTAKAIKQQLQLDKQYRQRDKLITSHDDILGIHSSKLDGGKAMIKKHKKHKKKVEEIKDRRVLDRNERKYELSNNSKFHQVCNFFSEVEERLGSLGLQEFLSYFEIYQSGKIKRQNLNDLVATCLGEFPDLMDEYRKVLDEGESIELFIGDDQLLRSSKLEDRERDQKREVIVCKESTDNHEKYNDFVDQAENIESFGGDDRLLRSSKLEDRERDQKHEVTVFEESKETNEKYNDFMDQAKNFESFGGDDRLLKSSKLEDGERDQKREVIVSKESEENHEKYNDFVDRAENTESFGGEDRLLRSSKLEEKERDQKLEVIVCKESKENHEKYNDFVNQDENTGQLQRSPKLEDRVSKENKELIKWLFGFEEEDPPICHVFKSNKEDKEKHDEKYMGISIHKLDLSDCEHSNASYRRLPEDYPIPIPIRRSELDTEVLNDHWVSVASGSEEEAFKHLRQNPYEETLFQIEEDQFELDLLIKRVKSTAKHAKDFYNSITGNEINIKNPIRIEKYLSVLHLRCIEKLYDDHGREVIEALRKNPVVALPVIMRRLQQKRKEWRECRSEFNKVWAKVYAKNHEKSRDHRSLSFKQEDSKNLKPKALMAEIKGIKEKLPNQEWLQDTAAGYELSPIPHMQFEYSDVEIHEDLYKLVCHASNEIVGRKCMLDKMLGIWTTFLEPMLGVHSRSDKLAATENRRDGSENVDCNAKVIVGKSQSGNVSRVEHCDMATPDSFTNRVLIQSNNQEEKEEGEISPSLNGDYDDDAFECSEDVSGREYSQEEHEGKGDKEHDDIDDKAKVERMCKAQSATDGSLLESSFLSAKPVSKYIPPVLLEERRESRVIYGNDDFYVLFRLHHILYERILSAKTNSMKSEVKRRVAKNANSPDPYSRFMNALYNFIGGSVDEAKFEGECLAIFGHQSYMLFTLDKLIHKLVKQLQVVANAEINDKILQLFEYENSQKPERLTHLASLGNARVILPDENIYRLECSSGPCKLFIWLTDRTNEMATAINPNYADYLYNDFLSVFPLKEEPKGVILQRHKRKSGASDEFPDMEGVIVINQLDHVMACNSSKSKMMYAPYKEDVLYRRRKKQKTWSKHNKAREERYHRFLSKC